MSKLEHAEDNSEAVPGSVAFLAVPDGLFYGRDLLTSHLTLTEAEETDWGTFCKRPLDPKITEFPPKAVSTDRYEESLRGEPKDRISKEEKLFPGLPLMCPSWGIWIQSQVNRHEDWDDYEQEDHYRDREVYINLLCIYLRLRHCSTCTHKIIEQCLYTVY